MDYNLLIKYILFICNKIKFFSFTFAASLDGLKYGEFRGLKENYYNKQINKVWILRSLIKIKCSL